MSGEIEVLASDEGTTQGGLLAISMYAVGIMPLLHELQPTESSKFGLQMMQQVKDC